MLKVIKGQRAGKGLAKGTYFLDQTGLEAQRAQCPSVEDTSQNTASTVNQLMTEIMPYSNRRTCSEGKDVEVTLWGKVVEEEEENFLGTVQSIALQDKGVSNTVLLRLCALVTHNTGL